jgi:biotin carboxyl carrier protein
MNTLFAFDVPIDEVEKRTFSESISTNSQVVQLSSAKSSLMARLGGKILNYHIKEGDSVKKGQLIATIDSLDLASQITELKGLKKQLTVVQKNYNITNKLYKIGVESLQKLNLQAEEKMVITNQIEAIKSKLSLVKGRKGSQYRVYAQSRGRVEKILAPIHSVVNENEPLVSIIKGKESFLIKSFIPLKYATKIRVGQKGSIIYGEEEYKIHITQILPNIDQQTQKMTVLSVLDKTVNNLFVNTFLDSKLFLGKGKSYLTVKKSALSFFNNEWVVFVPEHHKEEGHKEEGHKEEEGHEEEGHEEKHDKKEDAKHQEDDAHAGHDHASHKEESHEKDDHDEHDHGKEEKEHNNHGEHEDLEHDEKEEHKGHGHDEEEEEEVPYGIKVVKILKQNENWVAIEGLAEHEDYVSDRSYYIKSLLLKSSLGGHGH